jgi:pSer/pThr/pTyr-binding forkhead associated (FHA) protein
MPFFISDDERCLLRPGNYTLGGRSANTLPLAALGFQPAVATVNVTEHGDVLIRRTTAAVVVRVNGEPLGVAPSSLPDGAQIEFDGCRISFRAERAPVRAGSMEARLQPGARELAPDPLAQTAPIVRDALRAHLVNTRTGAALPLTGRRVLIGRDDGCDLVIDGKGVSRRHASISPVRGGFQLRDESANGTIVNGFRVNGTCLLDHGDVVRLEDEELRFELDDVNGRDLSPGAASGERGEQTAVLDLSRVISEIDPGELRQPAGRIISGRLEIVHGPFSGAKFELTRPVCSIGRSEQSDVRIRDESVSSTHATLLRKGATWYITDLRSSNGTFVDGSRIAGERELPTGARVRIGAVEMVFRALLDGAAPEGEQKPRRGIRGWFASRGRNGG